MRAILKRVDIPAYEIDIFDELETYQEIVGGDIDAVIFPYEIAMVLNDNGKLIGLPQNFYCGMLVDEIVGNVVFVGVDGDRFVGLTDAQMLFIREKIIKED